MTWPEHSVVMRIPNDGDPRLPIMPPSLMDMHFYEQADSEHALRSFDLFRSRCAFVKKIHHARVMTRSMHKKKLLEVHNLLKQIRQEHSDIHSATKDDARVTNAMIKEIVVML